ncbi:hypothetical protein Phi13:2_gp082 [Cellulophaga phage phi13:2]|uniref:Uncharacterized protein n=2 Tax=Baltivirus TaxID=2946816 RepID=S0A5N9_9CAUD|nr:hypothetical protein Phi19:3_gp085 [Cellulophaga phage phi19:3]YP_008242107.1 hypothetical protein Phi13:2_gp082 [Cellulophaga phage phi13:2]AGO47489.1 hypothetical protein Phi19:3_gp085 [Cellulophaga phage phi19:3]AGO49692.1 hypothetical protein Phi13:2_gp082 [Cellulophaga phage phi13:2]
MSLINDEAIYALTQMVEGGTVLGSLPKTHPTNPGGTVQYSVSGILDFITGKLDFVHYNNATRAGQTVLINDPDLPETYLAAINDGAKCICTLKVYPPTSDSDVSFIVKLR